MSPRPFFAAEVGEGVWMCFTRANLPPLREQTPLQRVLLSARWDDAKTAREAAALLNAEPKP